jgi:hypothetical protein
MLYVLTPWNKDFLEKLVVSQLVKEFPASCGTPQFITIFTTATYLSIS